MCVPVPVCLCVYVCIHMTKIGMVFKSPVLVPFILGFFIFTFLFSIFLSEISVMYMEHVSCKNNIFIQCEKYNYSKRIS